ncbi:hypothetical protein D3C80_437490 [compost metagenome]
MQELVGGCNFAAGDTGQITDHALDFGNLVFFQPRRQLIERGIHKDLVIGFIPRQDQRSRLVCRLDDFPCSALRSILGDACVSIYPLFAE